MPRPKLRYMDLDSVLTNPIFYYMALDILFSERIRSIYLIGSPDNKSHASLNNHNVHYIWIHICIWTNGHTVKHTHCLVYLLSTVKNPYGHGWYVPSY